MSEEDKDRKFIEDLEQSYLENAELDQKLAELFLEASNEALDIELKKTRNSP